MKLHDVIVIGAGPVGSYLAYKLSDMGSQVLVLERGERPGEKVCCTGIVGKECVSSFPIDESVILRWANSATLFPPSGRPLRLRREEKQACIIERPAFDLTMASKARVRGAQYIFNSPVCSIEVRDKTVSVEVEQGGQRYSFEARAVVIASGFGSKLTERIGLGKTGDFVIGAQTEVLVTDCNEVEVYFGREVAPGFFAWLVPTSPGKALVGLLSRQSPGLYLRKLLGFLSAEGKVVSADDKLNFGGIPLKPLRRTYGERLIVVGDAAGQVKPTTGGGIYYGLLCAETAAHILREALASNDLSARNLARYERGWKKRLNRELRSGYWARKLYERLSDGQIDRIFDIIKSAGIDKALLEAEDLSFDWHGEIILRLLGHKALAKAVHIIKMPLLLRR